MDRNGSNEGFPSEPLRLPLRVAHIGASFLLLCPLPTTLLSSLFHYTPLFSLHNNFPPQLLLLVFTTLYYHLPGKSVYLAPWSNSITIALSAPLLSLPPCTFHCRHISTILSSSFFHLFLPSLLSVWPKSVLHGTGSLLCFFKKAFSLAKDGKFQRPELVMAGNPMAWMLRVCGATHLARLFPKIFWLWI